MAALCHAKEGIGEFLTDKKQEFHYGGQAVIEGVMMRGPKDFAVAVRRTNGKITSTTENVESMFAKLNWLKKPFLRGTFVLIDSMALGIKALKYATDIAMQDIDLADRQSSGQAAENADGADSAPVEKVNDATINAMMVVGLVLGVAFFILVPIIITRLLNTHIHVRWQLTAIEGLFKIALFVGYVAAISMLKDIRRVFQYHGAEHKTINAYEAGVELNPANVRPYSRIHVRCGTSFILVVLIASVVVYAFIGDYLPHGSLVDKSLINLPIRWAYHLILLPVVAGLGYEVIRFAGSRKDSILTKIMLTPGLLMQKITTREPDDDMLEVAIESLKGVLDKEAASTTEAAAD